MLAKAKPETVQANPLNNTPSQTLTTEAWVLYPGESNASTQPAPLQRELFEFADIAENEVLVETICGCWEANMTHALQRKPVDICRQRREARVVLGNAGVVRILKTGTAVTTVKTGDACVLFGNGVWDEWGYPVQVVAYDAPGTMGVLAKQLKLHQQQVIPIPQPSPYTFAQWAAFSVRYVSAWANWQIAEKCWRAQMPEADPKQTFVASWGGGVGLAECTLAQHFGYHALMFASTDERLAMGRAAGLDMLDRRPFFDLYYDAQKYQTDAVYRQRYQEVEALFVKTLAAHTNGAGAAIFIDNIGDPVFRATLKALARQGVIATCGWKHGMQTTHLRALACINRHIHVHTHFARYAEGVAAVNFAHQTGWMPPINEVYAWDAIPQLAADYEQGRIASYFPIFTVDSTNCL